MRARSLASRASSLFCTWSSPAQRFLPPGDCPPVPRRRAPASTRPQSTPAPPGRCFRAFRIPFEKKCLRRVPTGLAWGPPPGVCLPPDNFASPLPSVDSLLCPALPRVFQWGHLGRAFWEELQTSLMNFWLVQSFLQRGAKTFETLPDRTVFPFPDKDVY